VIRNRLLGVSVERSLVVVDYNLLVVLKVRHCFLPFRGGHSSSTQRRPCTIPNRRYALRSVGATTTSPSQSSDTVEQTAEVRLFAALLMPPYVAAHPGYLDQDPYLGPPALGCAMLPCYARPPRPVPWTTTGVPAPRTTARTSPALVARRARARPGIRPGRAPGAASAGPTSSCGRGPLTLRARVGAAAGLELMTGAPLGPAGRPRRRGARRALAPCCPPAGCGCGVGREGSGSAAHRRRRRSRRLGRERGPQR
jgi:hypothetical protein